MTEAAPPVHEEGDIPFFSLYGIRVDNITAHRALLCISRLVAMRGGTGSRSVVFVNVHSFHLARRDQDFRRCLNAADLVLPDGSGLATAGRLLGSRVVENLNGTDFTPRVLAEGERQGWTVYLFGASAAANERCRLRLGELFPRLKIAGSHHGHLDEGATLSLVEGINAVRPDILLVALGSPLQERWIIDNADRLHVGCSFAVGGLFDFLSGTVTRAPKWMRTVGIEWAFRFFQDPKSKWDRVLVEIPVFLTRIASSRLRGERVTTGSRPAPAPAREESGSTGNRRKSLT